MYVLARKLSKFLKYKTFNYCTKQFSNLYNNKPPWNVLFFGADSFSLYSLKSLYNEWKNEKFIKTLEVVTTTGGKPNPIHVFAKKENLVIHEWPLKNDIRNFDVGVVVSFGHLLPKNIIEQFPLGMLNVHASLLPRWRGAAPIIYTLANGDKETGVTIMKIRPKKFDVGEIISQTSISIGDDMRMPQLYSELGSLGAHELVKVMEQLPDCLNGAREQPGEGVTYAPRISPSFAVINWNDMTAENIYNLDRALTSLYNLTTTWNNTIVKLINVRLCDEGAIDLEQKPGFVIYDKSSNCLKVLCQDSRFICVDKVGVIGKKPMSARDFNNGYLNKEPVYNRYFRFIDKK